MKRISALLLTLVLTLTTLFGMSATVFADGPEGKDEYRPIDVVLVIDTSGSMQTSDSNHLVLSAMQMFINMMPVADSRVAVVGFNEKATVYTTQGGSPAFVEMSDLSNLESLRGTIDGIKYDGDTAVGNGLAAAADLFKNNARPDAEKAVVLFSDGVDDLNSKVKYQEAQDNLTEAVVWSSQNNCPVYPIGFNYKLNDGKNSLGNTGIDKLNYISEKSNGYTTEVNTLDDIEDTFVEILARICKLKYTELEEVPGDGQYHEVPIKVPAGVVEMNIRIGCNTEDALANGTIQLLDKNKQEIILANSDSVRYDVEKTAVTIKVLKPEAGEYTLVLDKITGDNIKIGFLNHYQVGMTAKLGLPAGNPENTGYAGDTVEVQAILTTEDGQAAGPEYYEDVIKAEAVITPRANGASAGTIPLTYEDGMLKGSFQTDGASATDIAIEVQTDAYTKNASLILNNGNRPLELTGTTLPDQTVKVKKTVTVSDIYSVVNDAEGDAITATIKEVSDPDVLTADVQGDTIEIKGTKWGSAAVTVEYTDAQNNKQETTFAVKVKDPLKVALLSSIPFIIAAIVLALVLITLANAKRITGTFDIGPVMINVNGMNYTIGRQTKLRAVSAARGRKTNLRALMRNYVTQTEIQPYITNDQRNALNQVLANGMRGEVTSILNQITLEGTPFGKKGFTLVIPKGLPVEFGNPAAGGIAKGVGAKVPVQGIRQITLNIVPTSGTQAVRITINYNQRGR